MSQLVIVPDSPEQFPAGVQVTAQLLAERAAYVLSDVVFDYGSPEFALDRGVVQWFSHKRANLNGEVPDLVRLQQRAGAGAAVLGYLANKPSSRGAILATLSTLREILPTLHINQNALQGKKLVFYVAAVDYDFSSKQLYSSTAAAVQLAREFGFPALVSDLNSLTEFEATNALAHKLSANGPVVHIYEGIRGTSQARTLRKALDFSLVAPRPATPAVSVSDSFAAVNKLYGLSLSPVEIGKAHGSSLTALVGSGVPRLAELAAATDSVPVSVRLFSAETSALISAALSGRTIVLGQRIAPSPVSALYQEVAASLVLNGNLNLLPSLSEVVYDDDNSSDSADVQARLGLTEPLPKSGQLALVWAGDHSPAAALAAPLARAAAYAGLETAIYSKFDQLARGGAVEHQVRLGSSSGSPIECAARASVGLVADVALLGHVDVSARLEPGAELLVHASSTEALEKAIPAAARRRLAESDIKLRIYDYSAVDSAATQGRTQVFLLQILLWRALSPELSADQITSRIVHSNTQDMELVAATIQALADAIDADPPQPVDSSAWKESEAEHTFSTFKATAFEPAEVGEREIDSSILFSPLETAQRVLLPEAFSASRELRPDLPTTTYIAKVRVNDRVTPADYDRHIFHLELDISGTGLRYAIGEALGVHAPNSAEHVSEFISWYGLDATAVISLSSRTHTYVNETLTVFQLLRDHLDLFGKVPKRFYEGLAEYATDAAEKAALERIASPAGSAELKQRAEEFFDDYTDILREFPSAHPPIEALIELIAPLKRREYSIASSQRVHPNAVHLLVVVVDWKHRKEAQRFGQCSHFLAELKTGAEVVVSVKRSVMKLPQDSRTPIIMAGLGTGLAPFKAFLEEKYYQRDVEGKEVGDIYLFLGSRHRREEYLYGEIFEAYKASGLLTHIGAAFSRDQAEKIYIQHRISQAKDMLTDAFVTKEGNFYLCGPTWPVPDISAALADIVTSANPSKKIDTQRLIEELKDEERYILEVY